MSNADNSTLEGLLAGYRRFRRNGWSANRERWEKLSEGQSPKTMVIACSDSRVDPAQIFDVDPGEIFVVRNVAAMVPPYETTPGFHGVSAALEFAVQVLEVHDVLIMGHGRCGGCQAALTQNYRDKEPGKGGFVAQWMSLLDDIREPIVHEHGTVGREAEHAMELAAIRKSIDNLRTFPFVQDKEKYGELRLRGAFFAISDGVLHLLDSESGEFSPVE